MKIRNSNCEHFPNKENAEGAIKFKKTYWADKPKMSKNIKNLQNARKHTIFCLLPYHYALCKFGEAEAFLPRNLHVTFTPPQGPNEAPCLAATTWPQNRNFFFCPWIISFLYDF